MKRIGSKLALYPTPSVVVNGKSVPFEMPTYQYLKTGDVIVPCMSLGKG